MSWENKEIDLNEEKTKLSTSLKEAWDAIARSFMDGFDNADDQAKLIFVDLDFSQLDVVEDVVDGKFWMDPLMGRLRLNDVFVLISISFWAWTCCFFYRVLYNFLLLYLLNTLVLVFLICESYLESTCVSFLVCLILVFAL